MRRCPPWKDLGREQCGQRQQHVQRSGGGTARKLGWLPWRPRVCRDLAGHWEEGGLFFPLECDMEHEIHPALQRLWAAPEALPGPRCVAETAFDEGRKWKRQGWVLPGSPDTLASPSSGLGVSGVGGGLGSLSGRCARSSLVAPSDSPLGFRTDRVTAGVWGKWGWGGRAQAPHLCSVGMAPCCGCCYPPNLLSCIFLCRNRLNTATCKRSG